MTTQSPTLTEVVKELIAGALGGVHTAFPATVVSYDKTAQKATVQPSIRGRRFTSDGELETYKLPTIPNVPVLFFSAGGHSITFPINNGDTGWVFCAERSLDEWKTTGGSNNDPRDPRRFDLSDAAFMPAGRPFSNPVSAVSPSSDLVIDGTIALGSAAPSDFVALASLVQTQLNTLKAIFDGWVPVPNDGGAALKTALSAGLIGWPGNMASSKVKAE